MNMVNDDERMTSLKMSDAHPHPSPTSIHLGVGVVLQNLLLQNHFLLSFESHEGRVFSSNKSLSSSFAVAVALSAVAVALLFLFVLFLLLLLLLSLRKASLILQVLNKFETD